MSFLQQCTHRKKTIVEKLIPLDSMVVALRLEALAVLESIKILTEPVANLEERATCISSQPGI